MSCTDRRNTEFDTTMLNSWENNYDDDDDDSDDEDDEDDDDYEEKQENEIQRIIEYK
jgi:hypothetical protein